MLEELLCYVLENGFQPDGFPSSLEGWERGMVTINEGSHDYLWLVGTYSYEEYAIYLRVNLTCYDVAAIFFKGQTKQLEIVLGQVTFQKN